jgi:hypothetical protein
MELDFSFPWRIVPPVPDDKAAETSFPAPSATDEPVSFAAAELAAVLGRMVEGPSRRDDEPARVAALTRGDGSESAHVIFLHVGTPKAGKRTPRAAPFSWRAEPERVEIYGETGRGLVRGIYDFLDALGARWVEPGPHGERLPRGPRLELARASRRSPEGESAATLILGHAVYFLRWREYLTWAARAGYTAVFVHTTSEALAFGAIPARLYERDRAEFERVARRLGLAIELGGHHLSSFLPRSNFKSDPALFRMQSGNRSPDSNFCASNPRSLEIVARNFASFALSHPEVDVFHAWPDDLPGGGWCSCPDCARLSPAAQSLAVARVLADALASAHAAVGPGSEDGDASHPRLSFLAYHDTEELAGLDLSMLPHNLELLWAPRRRCWAHGLGQAEGDAALCPIDASSAAAYRAASAAWDAGGGGGVAVFEYWEDALLFKGAVPPLSRTVAGDAAVYAGSAPGASERSIGILLTGGRLPLGPRPNPWLLPRLLRRAAEAGEISAKAEEERSDWVRATYGPAAGAMEGYWRALEAAWAIDLDLRPGDTETTSPPTGGLDVDDPPTDWGDPWTASPERLEEKRGRCDELFDRLREAEAALAEATAMTRTEGLLDSDSARAVEGEASEYGIASNLLELHCARLAVYHERAAGQAAAAADIALLAMAPYAALTRALTRLPDRRSRREMRVILLAYYGIRLRAIRREARATPLGRLVAKNLTLAELGIRSLALRHVWESPPRPRRER